MQKLKLKKEYQKYPEYKDSGIDWLGEIPAKWEISKIRHLGILFGSTVDKKINPGDRIVNLVNYMDVYKSNKITNSINFMQVSATNQQRAKYQIEKGDVFFTPSSETSDDIGHSSVVLNDLPNTLFSYHLTKLKFLKDVDDNFKKYLFNNLLVFNQFSLKSTGMTRMILRNGDFKTVQVIIPERKEQQKIAKYLDIKTDLIDQIIEKKKQLIELLKEKRTAIINQAVTKGLNGNVEMKDGGIEWIGKIPENWSIKKLKFIAKINERTLSEYTNPNNTIEYLDISNVGTGLLKNEPVEMIFRDAPNRARRLVKAGSVILATVRTYLRAIAFFEKPIENLVVSTGFAVFDANKKIIKNKFLYYFALSEFFVSNVASQSTGVSYPAIAPTTLGKLPIFIPDLNEQEKIMQFLDKETDKVEIFSKKVKKSINLLSEFKSSLISNVVTGKVKI